MVLVSYNATEYINKQLTYHIPIVMLLILIGAGDPMSGFLEFTYKEVIPVCFIVPIQAFDMDDAQAFLVKL